MSGCAKGIKGHDIALPTRQRCMIGAERLTKARDHKPITALVRHA